MSRTLMSRQQRLQETCGPLSEVSVRIGKHGTMVFVAKCIPCTKGGDRWATTYRSGYDNDYLACVSRWNRHVAYTHTAEAPPSVEVEAAAVARGYRYESPKQKASRLWEEAFPPTE